MRNCITMLAALLAGQTMAAQAVKEFTMQQFIDSAKNKSLLARVNKTQKEVAFYQYLSFNSTLKPQILFYGNIPSYSNDYFDVLQPDGTIKFLQRRQNFSNAGFSLTQQIAATGGQVSLNSNISRFDDFSNKVKLYNGTPVYFNLTQPIFGFNELKWGKKIEPLKLEEANRKYIQEMENIGQQIAAAYFDVLEAQNGIESSKTNYENSVHNYTIEKERINLGTTTEARLLQLELISLKSKQEQEKSKFNYQIALLNLKSQAGLFSDGDLKLTAPDSIPNLLLDINNIIQYARESRPEYIGFKRKKLESQRDINQAASQRKQINLIATVGYNNTGNEVRNVYENMRDQQRFSIGFNIPLVDWGRYTARVKTAEATEKLIDYNNELQEQTMVQQIISLVRNIQLLKSNIALAVETNSVARRRFEFSNQLFELGKLSITELSIAQTEKDQARRDYLAALREFWNAYFMLRVATLYDVEKGTPLTANY